MLSYMVWWGLQGTGYTLFEVRFGIQMFAVLALIPTYLHTKSGLKINKWVFYRLLSRPSDPHHGAGSVRILKKNAFDFAGRTRFLRDKKPHAWREV